MLELLALHRPDVLCLQETKLALAAGYAAVHPALRDDERRALDRTPAARRVGSPPVSGAFTAAYVSGSDQRN